MPCARDLLNLNPEGPFILGILGICKVKMASNNAASILEASTARGKCRSDEITVGAKVSNLVTSLEADDLHFQITEAATL